MGGRKLPSCWSRCCPWPPLHPALSCTPQRPGGDRGALGGGEAGRQGAQRREPLRELVIMPETSRRGSLKGQGMGRAPPPCRVLDSRQRVRQEPRATRRHPAKAQAPACPQTSAPPLQPPAATSHGLDPRNPGNQGAGHQSKGPLPRYRKERGGGQWIQKENKNDPRACPAIANQHEMSTEFGQALPVRGDVCQQGLLQCLSPAGSHRRQRPIGVCGLLETGLRLFAVSDTWRCPVNI